jgi:hypothetical protein
MLDGPLEEEAVRGVVEDPHSCVRQVLARMWAFWVGIIVSLSPWVTTSRWRTPARRASFEGSGIPPLHVHPVDGRSCRACPGSHHR